MKPLMQFLMNLSTKVHWLAIVRIQKRFRDWEDSGITGLTINGDEQALRLMAEVARLNVDPNV